MGKVDRCTEDDVPAIAELHSKVKFDNGESNSDAMRGYYRDVFFRNPWYNNRFPSFVYRAAGGRVVGFIGVIPRQMRFRGNLIKVAVSHRLMVDPDSGCPLAASQLVRRFLSGPQDLSFSDGANDMGRKFWEGMGGSTVLIYSMNWIRPLRPFSYAAYLLAKRKGSGLIAAASSSVGWLVDTLGAAKWMNSFLPTQTSDYRSVEADDDLLFCCISEFSKPYTLCPEYDYESWKWLMDFLRSNKHRGMFRACAVYKGTQELIGAYVYYLNASRVGEVMLLLARNDSRDKVLRHLLYEARKQNALCFWGRMEPKFLSCLWDNNCLLKQGSWALVNTNSPELAEVINRGDAFLTAMEGELWLRSPRDRL